MHASADALEGKVKSPLRRASLCPYPGAGAQAAPADKLEADRRTLRTGMEQAQRKLKQAEQTVYAAAEAAVEALTAQQTAAQKGTGPAHRWNFTGRTGRLAAARGFALRGKSSWHSGAAVQNGR